jgi:hypothetical protein
VVFGDFTLPERRSLSTPWDLDDLDGPLAHAGQRTTQLGASIAVICKYMVQRHAWPAAQTAPPVPIPGPSYPMDIAAPPGYFRAERYQSMPLFIPSCRKDGVNYNILVSLNNFRIGL